MVNSSSTVSGIMQKKAHKTNSIKLKSLPLKNDIKPVMLYLFMLMSLVSCKQKRVETYLIAFAVTDDQTELWGYKNTSGDVVVKPAYSMITSDTIYDMGFVVEGSKWFAINNKGEKILEPFVYDNGVDYEKEGLFRFIENEKMGFADMKGNKVIPASFDFVSPFSEGLAAFNAGGKSVQVDEEHEAVKEGLWGYIDNNGKVVIEAQFAKAGDFSEANAEVWQMDGKHLLIDKSGKVVEELPEVK